MTDTSARPLTLMRIRRDRSGQELAERLGVSTRSIHRVVNANVLTAVAPACRGVQPPRFDHRRHDGAEERLREVEPHRMAPWGRRWYLWRGTPTGTTCRSAIGADSPAAPAFLLAGLEIDFPVESTVELAAALRDVTTRFQRAAPGLL